MALVTELLFRIGCVALNIGRRHAKTIKESAYVSIRSQAPKGSSSHPCPSRRIGPRGFGIPDLMRVNPAHNGIAMAKVAGTAFPQVLAGCRTGVGLSQAPKGSSSHPCPSRRIGPRGFGIPDLMRVNPAHNGIAKP